MTKGKLVALLIWIITFVLSLYGIIMFNNTDNSLLFLCLLFMIIDCTVLICVIANWIVDNWDERI